MDKLKPCPFCGNENVEANDRRIYAQVTCGRCDAAGPCCNDLEEAIERWNAVPRKEDTEMEKNCGNCKYNQDGYCSAVPPYKYSQVDSHLCCTDWKAKESKSTPLSTDTITQIARKTWIVTNVQQLLEEASELITACCKYLRAMRSGQPTPVTPEETVQMIAEELADVHVVGEVMRRQNGYLDAIYTGTCGRKAERWLERLEGEDEE